MQNAETVLDVLQSPESPVHRKGARWVRRKAARKRPTPDHRERDLAAQPILLLDELLQHYREVAGSGDQEVVEAFPAQGADEPFRDRIRTRCPDWGADDLDVGAGEHGVERGVSSVEDKESVEEFAADCPDEALGDRIRPRCPHRRLDDPGVDGGEDGVERGGELGVAIADEEPETTPGVVEIHGEVAGLLGQPGSGGCALIPRMCTRLVACSMTKKT